MKNIVFLFIFNLITISANSQDSLLVDTIYVEKESFWYNSPEGGILCGLFYDDGEYSFEYFEFEKFSNFVYCVEYRNNKITKEGLKKEYYLTETQKCWSDIGVWKYYDQNSNFERIENLGGDLEKINGFNFEVSKKFKIILK